MFLGCPRIKKEKQKKKQKTKVPWYREGWCVPAGIGET
jgi:hypothetical protein